MAHWKDRAISKAEVISDGFEVAKAYGAHLANWILFFCLIANILEMFQLPFVVALGNAVLGIQSVTLDVAGFGLATMATHAKSRGDKSAAWKAGGMGWALIIIMMITVALVAISIIFPNTSATIDMIEKGLILVRIVATVLYGHVVHSVRHASNAYDHRLSQLQQDVSNLQTQLASKQQEAVTAQKSLSSLQVQFSSEQEKARLEIETLRGKLEVNAQEIKLMASDQAGVITLRRDLNATKIQAEELQSQLDAKQQVLKNEQLLTANLRREVERFQQNGTQQFVPPAHVERQSGTLAGPKLVPLPHRNETNGTQQLQSGTDNVEHQSTSETSENAKAKILLYRLIEEDNTRQVADLMRLTNLPKTTVWRHFDKYHKEHGTRTITPIASGE